MSTILPNHTPRFVSCLNVCVFLSVQSLLATAALPGTPGTTTRYLPAAPKDRPVTANSLLQRSLATLQQQHSIAAEVAHCVNLFGKRLVGKGVYREERSGPYPLVRFELKTATGETQSGLLQVCDGQYMWTRRDLLENVRIYRVDLDRVTNALEEQGRAGGVIKGVSCGELGGIVALGGMTGLLRALQESFQFDSFESDVLYDLPVWRLRGQWKADKLAKLLPEQAETIKQGRGEVDFTQLPEHIPDCIFVTLGKDDFFPYRLEFHRTEKLSGDSHMIAAMQLMKVSFNVPLDPKCFTFEPEDLPVIDRTEEYIAKVAKINNK